MYIPCYANDSVFVFIIMFNVLVDPTDLLLNLLVFGNCICCLLIYPFVLRQYVFNNGQMDHERLKELVHLVGKQRLVLDLSCRKKVCNFRRQWCYFLC
ncbi:1-(5-phosphoribosyl)-5-((5-phosphoribosylamino)methylideneamino)imidazole-4-carboxamide isomerase [Helianthus anomalus]